MSPCADDPEIVYMHISNKKHCNGWKLISYKSGSQDMDNIRTKIDKKIDKIGLR
jgi:hypothetical protein